jgi:hypothetical protein
LKTYPLARQEFHFPDPVLEAAPYEITSNEDWEADDAVSVVPLLVENDGIF